METRDPECDGTRIRLARVDDVAIIARLHATSIPDGFLQSLGPRFLRHLYVALICAEDAVVLVADEGGQVTGFAAGVLDTGSFYRTFYRRRGMRAAVAALLRLTRPAVLRGAVETARYGRARQSVGEAELLSIAVAPERRLKGVGVALGAGMLRELSAMGAQAVTVVVGAANAAANTLYEHLGFTKRSQITIHAGVQSNIWIIQCRPS